MTDVKISQLPSAATPLTGSEIFPLVQNGVTVNSTLNTISSAVIANDANFIANGTGAVYRTVQSKLRDFVSVMDFGATGNGVTDDSPAIQAAINAANNVFFPPGTYVCNSQIVLRANLTIVGSGMGISRVKKVTTTYGGVFCANSGSTTEQLSNINISDITLFDDVVTLGFAEQQHLLTFHGVNNVNVTRVELYGFRGDGIYIGQWNEAIRIRLNTNITISGCIFDGVNKDNRNGLSVITGSYIKIIGNSFKNTTRSNQPGAIDLEPDTFSSTSLITNVVISNNTFYDIGGNVGAISIYIPSTVAAFNTISITGNVYDTCVTDMVCIINNRTSGEFTNISVTGNSGTNVGRLFRLLGNHRGVTISSNTAEGAGVSLIGFNATDTINDIIVSNNSMRNPSTNTQGAIGIAGQTTDILITNNAFDNWYDYGVKLGTNAGDSLSKITISHNTARNLRGQAYMALYAAGTLDGSTCTYRNNIGASNASRFWRTDDCGGTTNGVTPTSFNSTTLPDSFSAGESMAVVNGDTGVPNVGGYQGTLVTRRSTPTNGFQKYTFQYYYPANNGVKPGSFYSRKRSSAANTWDAWYEHVGV